MVLVQDQFQLQLQQKAVQKAVAVIAEDICPDEVHIACQAGEVENQGQNRTHTPGELVNQPSHEEAEHIADRACNHGKYGGIFDGNPKYFVVKKHTEKQADFAKILLEGIKKPRLLNRGGGEL